MNRITHHHIENTVAELANTLGVGRGPGKGNIRLVYEVAGVGGPAKVVYQYGDDKHQTMDLFHGGYRTVTQLEHFLRNALEGISAFIKLRPQP